MEHNLKIDAIWLERKLHEGKLFEIRNNDRGFQKGDIVIYTKIEELETYLYKFEITYVCNYMQKKGYVVFCEKRIF